jgi:uncharacterized membrane protein YkvA (DUF1232 family)
MRVKEKLKLRIKRIKLDIATLSLALTHKDTPKLAKIMIVISVGYACSPIDLIPDFIPVLGFLDDVLLLPLLIMIAIKLIPDDILKECRNQTKELQDKSKPFWVFFPVLITWILLIALLVYILL